MPYVKSGMSPKSPSGSDAVKLASAHLLSPAANSTSRDRTEGHGGHSDNRALHGAPLLSDSGYTMPQWPAMIPPHMGKPPFPPAPHLVAGVRSRLPMPPSLMMPPTRAMLARWPNPNTYGANLPAMGPGGFVPDVGHSPMNPAGLPSPSCSGNIATPNSQVQFLATACNVDAATSHPLNRLSPDPLQHHSSFHSMAKVAQMHSITRSMSPTLCSSHDDLQTARMHGYMADGQRTLGNSHDDLQAARMHGYMADGQRTLGNSHDDLQAARMQGYMADGQRTLGNSHDDLQAARMHGYMADGQRTLGSSHDDLQAARMHGYMADGQRTLGNSHDDLQAARMHGYMADGQRTLGNSHDDLQAARMHGYMADGQRTLGNSHDDLQAARMHGHMADGQRTLGNSHDDLQAARMQGYMADGQRTLGNSHDDLQAARMQGYMADGQRSQSFWHMMQQHNGLNAHSPGGIRRHMAHELNDGVLKSNLHLLNDPLRVETTPSADIAYHLMNNREHERGMSALAHQRAAAMNMQRCARDDNSLLCIQRPPPPSRWQAEPSVEDDGMNDLIEPSIVDHMVRYIERSLDDVPAPDNHLADIHIGHGNVPAQTAPPGDKAPLYLRGAGSQQSYASAVRSRPLPSSMPSELDADVGLMYEQPNPLDLLKNLNIKASPGTQAFYQYFS